MRKTEFYLFISIILLCSCRGRMVYNKLVSADTLMCHDMLDSAYNELKRINTYDIRNAEDSAYYNLLLTQAEYRLDKPIANDSLITTCVDFFDHNGDKEKLASACYYKCMLMREFGKKDDAVIYLKKAESLAANIDNIVIKHKINQTLWQVNSESGNYNLALKYAKKAMDNSIRARNKEWIATAYMNMASVYSFLMQSDSANYYLQKYIPLIKYLPEDRKSAFVSGIGFYYYRIKDFNKAKQYCEQAIAMKPIAESYALLAEIVANEGQDEKAESLYTKAMDCSELFFKIDILQSYSEWKYRKGEYKKVGEIDRQINMLKDSLASQRRSETVHQLQVQFDNKMQAQRNKRYILITKVVIILLGLAIVISLITYWRRVKKARKEIADNQKLLDAYHIKLQELAETCEEQTKEVAQQRKKIDTMSKRQSEMLARGHDLYQQIAEGGNALMWHKEDFNDFIEYYRLNNLQFVRHLEDDYKQLSPSNKFFMILYNMGKTDSDVKKILNLTNGALRTARSRIKAKKKEKGDE
jgi:tetratricopeptide (TPR) repeat protein